MSDLDENGKGGCTLQTKVVSDPCACPKVKENLIGNPYGPQLGITAVSIPESL